MIVPASIPQWWVDHIRRGVDGGSPILKMYTDKYGIEWYAVYRLELAVAQAHRSALNVE